MRSVRPAPLPLGLQLSNTAGEALQRTKVLPMSFDEEALLKSAVKTAGRDDFGDPCEGLKRLVESIQESDLTFIGRFYLRQGIVDFLVNRLLLVEAPTKQAEMFQRPLRPPLIVLGLARSGTTFLHRLLAQDLLHRPVPYWERVRPLPKNAGDTPERRRKLAVKELNLRHRMAPELDSIHFIRADTPEECLMMLPLTFTSSLFWVAAPLYGYLEWYMRQDFIKKYQDYRALLHVLQAAQPEKRVVMKAPGHTGALDALLRAVP